MRTSIYLAVAFAILFISLSDAAVYKRQSGNGAPRGSGLAKSISNGMKTRSNMLQRRRVYRYQAGRGTTVKGATNGNVSGFVNGRKGSGNFLGGVLDIYSGLV